MKKSKHFAVEELVPPEVLKAEGENSWKHLSANLIDGIDGFYEILHEQIKLQDGEKLMIIINDWRWGGQYHESGFRILGTSTGATNSQHKKGSAVDIKVKIKAANGSIRVIPAIQVQKILLDNQNDPRVAMITRTEKNPPTTGWTHIDCKVLVAGQERIRVFQP